MIIVTTEEAADLAGVSPVTIRQWVRKGWLTPMPVLDPTRRHHLFARTDVVRCEFEHRTLKRRAAYKRAQQVWRAAVADA